MVENRENACVSAFVFPLGADEALQAWYTRTRGATGMILYVVSKVTKLSLEFPIPYHLYFLHNTDVERNGPESNRQNPTRSSRIISSLGLPHAQPFHR